MPLRGGYKNGISVQKGGRVGKKDKRRSFEWKLCRRNDSAASPIIKTKCPA